MNISLRKRLTLWYVSLLTISLISISGIYSYTLFKIFINRIDNQISSVAGMMVHTVIKPSGELLLPRNFDVILERFFGIKTSGRFIQILGPKGVVRARSSSLEGYDMPLSQGAYNRALGGATTFETIKIEGRHSVRVISKPVRIRGNELVAILQVGSSLDSIDEIFDYMIYIFIFGTLIAIGIASGVGWFLASKALGPVDEITRIARRIGAENLSERIDINSQDELGRLAATFNDMIEGLEHSFDQVKQFTADASHELKTPLTVLKGEMEVTLRGEESVERMKEVLKSSLEEIDRMTYIITSLLDLAKVGIESGEVSGEVVHFDEIVEARFDRVGRLAHDKGIRLKLLHNAPLLVVADPVRLGQLVSNLIHNAIKYTHDGGSVDVSLRELVDGETHLGVFTVKDSGIGISGEDMPHLFDRFYRVDKVRTRSAGGAGLGLSICREIAESYGGKIEVSSEVGRGSEFKVTFPTVTGTVDV